MGLYKGGALNDELILGWLFPEPVSSCVIEAELFLLCRVFLTHIKKYVESSYIGR